MLRAGIRRRGGGLKGRLSKLDNHLACCHCLSCVSCLVRCLQFQWYYSCDPDRLTVVKEHLPEWKRNMEEDNSGNPSSSSTTIASAVIAFQFIAKSRKSAQRWRFEAGPIIISANSLNFCLGRLPILCRRDHAVIEQPTGAARGRNLRDAILKKEQVLQLSLKIQLS